MHRVRDYNCRPQRDLIVVPGCFDGREGTACNEVSFRTIVHGHLDQQSVTEQNCSSKETIPSSLKPSWVTKSPCRLESPTAPLTAKALLVAFFLVGDDDPGNVVCVEPKSENKVRNDYTRPRNINSTSGH